MIQQARSFTQSIVAHRGVSAQYPENTRTAFEAAVLCGADAMEFDLQITTDRHIVICHNPRLDHYGYPHVEVTSSTLQQLQALDIGQVHGRRFSGERLMTFDEMLSDFGSRIPLYVEFKTKDMTAEQVDALISEFLRLTSRVRESLTMYGLCFDRNVLRQLHASAPWLPLVWNTNEPHLIAAEDLDSQPWLYAVGCRIGNLNRPTAERIHDAGLQLFSFTCNSEAEVLKARDLQVDSIISDDPDNTRSLLTRPTSTGDLEDQPSSPVGH